MPRTATAAPISVPEDLTGLTDDELADLGDRIDKRANDLRELGDDDYTEEVVLEIERLASDDVRVQSEAADRSTARTERASRARNALRSLDHTPEEEGETETSAETEMETLPPDQGGEGEGETEGESTDGEDDEDEDEEVEPQEPAGEMPVLVSNARRRGSLANMQARRPRAIAPRPKDGSFMVATNHAIGVNEGTRVPNVQEVAQLITRKRLSFSHVPDGVRDFVPIATGQKAIDHRDIVGGDPAENFAVLDRLRREHTSLVASGGCCAPFTPLYDFFRTAEPQSPIEDGLPVVQAPRGGIRYIVPPDFRDAMAGIGTMTCDDLADPQRPDKPCVAVECPPTVECSVVTTSQCVRFGNLNYRVFPEQVEAFMADLAVVFALQKEATYLAAIAAASTAVTSAQTYGASRDLLNDITVAGASYRKRNGMRRGATLQALIPDWAIDLIKVDMANACDEGLSYLSVTDAQVTGYLRDRNIDPIFYNDQTGPPDGIARPQAAGALNNLPTTVVWYLFAPGTFVRLDGGTLDVGLVRDSMLNRTNDLELFMEEWSNVCMLGIESVQVTSTVCPNGTAGACTTPFTCTPAGP